MRPTREATGVSEDRSSPSSDEMAGRSSTPAAASWAASSSSTRRRSSGWPASASSTRRRSSGAASNVAVKSSVTRAQSSGWAVTTIPSVDPRDEFRRVDVVPVEETLPGTVGVVDAHEPVEIGGPGREAVQYRVHRPQPEERLVLGDQGLAVLRTYVERRRLDRPDETAEEEIVPARDLTRRRGPLSRRRHLQVGLALESRLLPGVGEDEAIGCGPLNLGHAGPQGVCAGRGPRARP